MIKCLIYMLLTKMAEKYALKGDSKSVKRGLTLCIWSTYFMDDDMANRILRKMDFTNKIYGIEDGYEDLYPETKAVYDKVKNRVQKRRMQIW